MKKLVVNRRKLIGLGAASAATLALGGCDQFNFLGKVDDPTRNFLTKANLVSYRVQRFFIGGHALATEYPASAIRQPARPNGSTDPQTPDYLAIKADDFASYRLNITGLVNKPMSYTLAQLRNMAVQSQITRHDCVEGWSYIAKWTGTRLGPVLDASGIKPEAKYAVFHCYDSMGQGLTGPQLYYESCDLVDAHHPQTLLAYGLNDQALPIPNGAPVRVRIERALGYKQPKYVHTIELVSSFSAIRGGRGGFWEDYGYDWYAGI